MVFRLKFLSDIPAKLSTKFLQNFLNLTIQIPPQKLRETSLEDMASVCSVCGITKDEFAGKGIDWDTHLKQEHNLWSYINLFYYLKTNKRNSKLSAIEDEVSFISSFDTGT